MIRLNNRAAFSEIFPLPADLNRAAAANDYVTVTATSDATTAHTMGAWVEVTAATAAKGNLLRVLMGANQAANLSTASMFDVSIGYAAGAEEAVIEGIQCGYATSSLGANTSPNQAVVHEFIVNVPKGSRIAIRTQGARVNNGQIFAVEVWDLPAIGTPAALPVVLGIDKTASKGVSLPNTTNAGVSAAWAEITASSPQHFRAVSLVLGGNNGSAMSNPAMSFDIGVGAAGSEQVVASQVALARMTTNEHLYRNEYGQRILPLNIPQGSRIVVRRGDRSTSGGANTCATIVGFPA
jgi:hypothetical protein